jgi:DNA polymerase III epsilon subunit-like protein
MTDVVFLDTETTGLSPDDQIWEFAAIRRFDSGIESELHLFIAHDETRAQFLPTSFFKDYKARFPASSWEDYWASPIAAARIQDFTLDAHIVGAVPNFDTERLAKLLRTHKLEPKWHYHLLDVENLVVGYLAGRGELKAPPWRSDDLSRAIGVDPAQFERHTAMGDAKWVRAQYDVVMGNQGLHG